MPCSAYQDSGLRMISSIVCSPASTGQQDAVVVRVRLGAEDGDVVQVGRDLQQFFERAHAGHAIAWASPGAIRAIGVPRDDRRHRNGARRRRRSGEKPEGGVNDGHDGLQGAIPDRPAWRSCITAHVDVRAAGAFILTSRFSVSGARREFNVARVGLSSAEGTPRLVCSLWTELTAHRQREAQLQQALAQLEQQQLAAEALRRETQDQTLRDNVTGLYQKMHFEDQLRREVDLSSREHREFSLVSIELDPPSEEVKAMGAEAHARILEALGRLLRGNTRAMDASCRLDNSRFAVLLSGVGLATAHSRMEGLRRQCATQIVVLQGRNIGFTVSMGVASFPHTAHTQDDLVGAAETALAEARKRGGNHVTLASIRFALE
jgi:diguanylate cyclase (GGDEF)-like protein